MKLTTHTDYALRMLMTLGVLDDRLVTIEELADRHRISRNHLMKVAQSLIGLGYVASARGRAGGVRLAKPPSSIRIGEVVRALEDNSPLVSCLGDGPSGCVLVGVCLLTRSLARSLDAFYAELDAITLADLILPRTALRERLNGSSRPDIALELPSMAQA
jgi:Rrf2 family nitric oxide-sensitive transcriptional repressor